jgi:hypothetical protein
MTAIRVVQIGCKDRISRCGQIYRTCIRQQHIGDLYGRGRVIINWKPTR